METVIQPRMRRTIEQGMCLFCDRRFIYGSNDEINRHMNIPLDVPFPTGLVYVSQKGYNIITPEGRLLDGTEFGGHLTHTYVHQVATGKYDLDGKLMFDPELKTRKVKDLERRFSERQIRFPTLLELANLQNSYEEYLKNQENKNSRAGNILKDLRPDELKGFCIEKFRLRERPKLPYFLFLQNSSN